MKNTQVNLSFFSPKATHTKLVTSGIFDSLQNRKNSGLADNNFAKFHQMLQKERVSCSRTKITENVSEIENHSVKKINEKRTKLHPVNWVPISPEVINRVKRKNSMCTDMKELKSKPKICSKLSQSMVSTAASVLNNATPQKPSRNKYAAQSTTAVHTFLVSNQPSKILLTERKKRKKSNSIKFISTPIGLHKNNKVSVEVENDATLGRELSATNSNCLQQLNTFKPVSCKDIPLFQSSTKRISLSSHNELDFTPKHKKAMRKLINFQIKQDQIRCRRNTEKESERMNLSDQLQPKNPLMHPKCSMGLSKFSTMRRTNL